MRTTVDLDEHLLRAAKSRAAALGQTLGAFVEHAVRQLIEREGQGTPAEFRLIEAGDPAGRCPSPAEVAALLEDQEIEKNA